MASKKKEKGKKEIVNQKLVEKSENLKLLADSTNILQISPENIRERANGVEKLQGIEHLRLSPVTQKLFNCVVGDDVTEDSNIVSVQKLNLLNDIKERGELSEFFPFYQEILEYPDEELVIVYDYNPKYNYNFYLCTTKEAKDRIKTELLETTEEKEDLFKDVWPDIEFQLPESIVKTSVSLGSDKEINKQLVKNSRNKICIHIKCDKKQSLRKIVLTDRDVFKEYDKIENLNIMNTTIPSVGNKIYRTIIDRAVQVEVPLKDQKNQIGFVLTSHKGNQYESRVYDKNKKKIFGEEEKITNFVQKSSELILKIINENLVSDIFRDYWLELDEEEFQPPRFDASYIKIFQSFTSLKYSVNKFISHISWHPTIEGVIIASCIESCSFYERIDKFAYLNLQPSLILFWSFIDPINPKLLLEAPDDVLIFKFNPTNPNLIAGGCINGQLVLWDLTTYQEDLKKMTEHQQNKSQTFSIYGKEEITKVPVIKYVASSGIENGHLSGILHLEWFPNNVKIGENGNISWHKSNFSYQLMTSGSDGFIKIWDIRPEKKTKQDELFSIIIKAYISIYASLDLMWNPIHSVKLTPPINGITSNVSVFSFDIIPIEDKESLDDCTKKLTFPSSNFLGGTMDGDIFYGDWKGFCNATGQLRKYVSPIYFECNIGGFVNTVQLSPFIKDIYLIIGGWKMTIWKSDIPFGPLLESSCGSFQRTAGHWSLTRPGIIFIGLSNGNIEIWDILVQTHEPIQIQNISSYYISKIKPKIIKDNSHILAISDANGTLHILELPTSLWFPVQNEELIIEEYFEWEIKRLRDKQKIKLDKEEALKKEEALRKDKEAEEISKALNEKTSKETKQLVQSEQTEPEMDEESFLAYQYEEYCKLEKYSLMMLDESSIVE